jgi:hypothetical protein
MINNPVKRTIAAQRWIKLRNILGAIASMRHMHTIRLEKAVINTNYRTFIY